MPENEKKKILDAEIDDDQLEKISGGTIRGADCGHNAQDGNADNNCDQNHCRPKGDCACTVEDGSWCYRNDACIYSAIDYTGCARAEAD